MKKLFTILLTITLLASCSESEPVKNYTKDGTLVYLIADNDLTEYINDNFQELENYFPENNTAPVFVYIDSYNITTNTSSASLYLLNSDKTTLIGSKLLKEYGVTNSSDTETIDLVFSDIKDMYSDIKISNILLSSHGKGWIEAGESMFKSAQEKSFGYDYSAGNAEIDIDKLATCLEKYDLETIIFDGCHMATIEVMYQLKDAAKTLVVSPAEILAEGIDYSGLSTMFAYNEIDFPKILSDYKAKYINSSYTLIYCNTDKLEDLALFNNEMFTKYDVKSNFSQLISHLPTYSPYTTSFFYDYYYFMQKIGMDSSDEDMFEKKFSDAVPQYVHSDAMFGITNLTNSHGVAFYPPKTTGYNKYNEFYKKLDWGNISGFNTLIE